MLAEFVQLCKEVSYHEPQIPLISNVTGQKIDSLNADYWIRHILQPVNFYAGMKTLVKLGSTCFIEIGPQSVLLGMGRQCFSEEELSQMSWLPSMRKEQEAWPIILRTLGHCYLKGVEVDWKSFYQPYANKKIELPTYPFHKQREELESRL
jgi:acyl transferase domain-containing protein